MSKINNINFDGAYLRSSSGHFYTRRHLPPPDMAIDYTFPQLFLNPSLNSIKNMAAPNISQHHVHLIMITRLSENNKSQIIKNLTINDDEQNHPP